jgi:hypothetical protein
MTVAWAHECAQHVEEATILPCRPERPKQTQKQMQRQLLLLVPDP